MPDVFPFGNDRYQKGLIVALKLKSSTATPLKACNASGSTDISGGHCPKKKHKKSKKHVVKEAEKSAGDIMDIVNPEENIEKKRCENFEHNEHNLSEDVPTTNFGQQKNATVQEEKNFVSCEELKDVFQRFGTVKVVVLFSFVH